MTKEYGVIKIKLGQLEHHKNLVLLLSFVIIVVTFPTNICIEITKHLLRIKKW